MKKILITTALVLTISSNANAYDRFLKLRQQTLPSIEVNYGALQYLQPVLQPSAPFGVISAESRPVEHHVEVKKRPAKPYRAPVAKIAPKPAPKIIQPKIAEIPALPKPISPPKAIIKPASEIPAMPKAPVAAPKTAPENLPLEMPKFVPEPPKMPAIIPPVNLKPVINPVLPEIVEKPVEKQVEKKPELVVQKFAPAVPAAPTIPALSDLPKLPTAPIAPAAKANEVVLPPLFPTNSASNPATSAAPKAPATPAKLPPIKTLFTGDSDKIDLPKLPDTSAKPAEVLPNIPAPKIADVQVNKDISKAPVLAQLPPQTTAKEVNFSFPFNETETELPLSEQAHLVEVAETLKGDENISLTVSAYASGTAEQSSQAKRTSLARALSVRRFMLERNIPSGQIVIRPYGNDSGNGVPDRVDIKVGKKVGA